MIKGTCESCGHTRELVDGNICLSCDDKENIREANHD